MKEKEYLDGVGFAWKEAAQVAGQAGHKNIEKAHILIGICRNACKPLRYVSEKVGINLTKLQNQLHERVLKDFEGGHNYPPTPDGVVRIPRSDECKKTFTRAKALAGSKFSCLHLLAAILENPADTIKRELQDAGVDHARLQELQNFPRSGLTCTNMACRIYGITYYLHKTTQNSARYIGEHSKDLTQTRAGKIELWLLGGGFIIFLISGFFLPKDIIRDILHRFHEAAIFAFIPFFLAEIYYVITNLKENKEISKLIRHVLINALLYSLLIYIFYKWFIAH